MNGKTADLLGQNKTHVISFFEPECSWCYKQSLVLNQLTELCNEISLSQIGIRGKFNELRRTALRLNTQLPVYANNRALETQFGRIPATPMTFLIDDHGLVLKKWRGYQDNKQLLHDLNQNKLCVQ